MKYSQIHQEDSSQLRLITRLLYFQHLLFQLLCVKASEIYDNKYNRDLRIWAIFSLCNAIPLIVLIFHRWCWDQLHIWVVVEDSETIHRKLLHEELFFRIHQLYLFLNCCFRQPGLPPALHCPTELPNNHKYYLFNI